jgi:hypothetical protein
MQPAPAALLHASFPLKPPSSTVFLATPPHPLLPLQLKRLPSSCAHTWTGTGAPPAPRCCAFGCPPPWCALGCARRWCTSWVWTVPALGCPGSPTPLTSACRTWLRALGLGGGGGCGPCFVSLTKHLPDVVCTTAVRQCGSHQTRMHVRMRTHTQAHPPPSPSLFSPGCLHPSPLCRPCSGTLGRHCRD